MSGDSVWIKFIDGKMQRIKIVGGIEGVYYPDELLRQRKELLDRTAPLNTNFIFENINKFSVR